MIKRFSTTLHQKLNSVFTKLLIIGLLAWSLILVSVVTAFLFNRHHQENPFLKNVHQYITYIAQDIGSPPDLEKAEEISEKTGVIITFIGNDTRWTTADDIPHLNETNFKSSDNLPKELAAHRFRRNYLRLATDDGMLYFIFKHNVKSQEDRNLQTHLFLFLLLSAILYGCYRLIKRVLMPLTWLKKGVADVATGNMSTQVPVRGNDELTELSRNFNAMTVRLDTMMKSRDHLLRDISHELRSPLTRIRVALAMIEDGDLEKDIVEDIDYMEKMISAILESSKLHHETTTRPMSPCNLTKLLRAVTKRHANTKPGIDFFAAGKDLIVTGDERGLQTLFGNLLDNAIKYSDHQEEPVKLELSQIENSCQISIQDHGVGIEEGDIPLLFEPFYRADGSRSRQSGGFGLGLSICRTIVHTHGGTISLTSTPGKGTTITVRLPLCNEQNSS